AFTWAAVGFLLLFAGDSLVRTVSWEAGAWTAAAAGLWSLGVTGTAAVCIVLALLVPALLPGVSNGSVFSLINQLRSGGRTVHTRLDMEPHYPRVPDTRHLPGVPAQPLARLDHREYLDHLPGRSLHQGPAQRDYPAPARDFHRLGCGIGGHRHHDLHRGAGYG